MTSARRSVSHSFCTTGTRFGMKTLLPFENCALPDIDATDAQETAVAKPVRNMSRVKKAVDCAPLKTARVTERRREKPQQRQATPADTSRERAPRRHAFIVKSADILGNGGFMGRTAMLHPECTEIDVHFSRLSEEKQKTLLEELSNPGITDLKQVSLNLSDSAASLHHVMEAIERMSRNNARVRIRLKLTDKRITHEDIAALAYALPTARITHLSLPDNALGNAGATVIFKVLGQSYLTHLNLDGNSIDYRAALAIADQLAQSKVTNLNLNHNRMGDPGSVAIAYTLSESNLTTLSLCFNRITHEGATILANALPQSKLLQLDLRGNNMSDSGVTYIASALPHCGITHLSLRENSIGDAGAAAIVDMLAQSSVTTLDLRGNNIGPAGAAALDNAQERITAVRIIR